MPQGKPVEAVACGPAQEGGVKKICRGSRRQEAAQPCRQPRKLKGSRLVRYTGKPNISLATPVSSLVLRLRPPADSIPLCCRCAGHPGPATAAKRNSAHPAPSSSNRAVASFPLTFQKRERKKENALTFLNSLATLCSGPRPFFFFCRRGQAGESNAASEQCCTCGTTCHWREMRMCTAS